MRSKNYGDAWERTGWAWSKGSFATGYAILRH